MNPFQRCGRKIVKTHARKNVRRDVYVWICMYMYVYVCICMCIQIQIYISIPLSLSIYTVHMMWILGLGTALPVRYPDLTFKFKKENTNIVLTFILDHSWFFWNCLNYEFRVCSVFFPCISVLPSHFQRIAWKFRDPPVGQDSRPKLKHGRCLQCRSKSKISKRLKLLMLQLQPLALKKNRFCRCFCFGLGWISDTDCMFSIVISFYISICKDEEHVGNTNIESNSLFFWSHVRMAEKTCMIGAEVANWAHLVDKWKWDASPSRWNLQSIDEYVQKDMYMYISYIYISI